MADALLSTVSADATTGFMFTPVLQGLVNTAATSGQEADILLVGGAVTERILISPDSTVQRGQKGTTAIAWGRCPRAILLCVQTPGGDPVDDTSDDDSTGSGGGTTTLDDPSSYISLGKGLRWSDTGALELAPTGVAPDSKGGLAYNECGQITGVAEGFPEQKQNAKCCDGATGPAGPAGPKGDRGDPGPKGDIGPAGPQGPVGPQGATGTVGSTGSAGQQGVAGQDGQDGQDGEDGQDGADGAPGEPPSVLCGVGEAPLYCPDMVDTGVAGGLALQPGEEVPSGYAGQLGPGTWTVCKWFPGNTSSDNFESDKFTVIKTAC